MPPTIAHCRSDRRRSHQQPLHVRLVGVLLDSQLTMKPHAHARTAETWFYIPSSSYPTEPTSCRRRRIVGRLVYSLWSHRDWTTAIHLWSVCTIGPTLLVYSGYKSGCTADFSATLCAKSSTAALAAAVRFRVQYKSCMLRHYNIRTAHLLV